MIHIRTETHRKDRRMIARFAPITAATLCGAPVTDRDCTKADAIRAARAGWPVCQHCLGILTRRDH